jgi:MFS family permease
MQPGPAFETPRSRVGLGVLLLLAMGVATYPAAVLSVLATFLIDDFGITRAEVALIATFNIAMSAILSPTAGRITDRVGGKRAFVFIYVLATAGFLALAVAPVYAVLLLAAIPAGFGQAAGNPATNKLIALHVPAGRQGVMMGVKQSGVQAVIFVGGLLVPRGAEAFGWRWTLIVLAILTAAIIPVVLRVIPRDRPTVATEAERKGGPLSPAIREMAIYGFLLGFGGSVTFLVPLFVEEALGGTPTLGGLAAALIGLSAFAGRIVWARHAERQQRFAGPLAAIALSAVAASLAFLLAQAVGLWVVWIAAVLTGLSASSWNSVGMLGVITVAGGEQAGRASGIVLRGFLAGLGLGAPLYGWTVDTTGSYTLMWWISLAAFVLAVLPLRAWARREAAA